MNERRRSRQHVQRRLHSVVDCGRLRGGGLTTRRLLSLSDLISIDSRVLSVRAHTRTHCTVHRHVDSKCRETERETKERESFEINSLLLGVTTLVAVRRYDCKSVEYSSNSQSTISAQ